MQRYKIQQDSEIVAIRDLFPVRAREVTIKAMRTCFFLLFLSRPKKKKSLHIMDT